MTKTVIEIHKWIYILLCRKRITIFSAVVGYLHFRGRLIITDSERRLLRALSQWLELRSPKVKYKLVPSFKSANGHKQSTTPALPPLHIRQTKV